MVDISKTLFVPLYFKYKESVGEKAIYDEGAVEFFSNKLNLNLINYQELDKDDNSFNGVIARSLIFDNYVTKIIKEEKLITFII